MPAGRARTHRRYSRPGEGLEVALQRIPDLTHLFHDAPTDTKRQLFSAFGLQITYDKPAGRIQLSATITEALADALELSATVPNVPSSEAVTDSDRVIPTARTPTQRKAA